MLQYKGSQLGSGQSRSSEIYYSKYYSISKSEVEMLIDAGFLSLAKKLYIDNEDAVTYILSMFYKNDFSKKWSSDSSSAINLTHFEITTMEWSKQSLANLCRLIQKSKCAYRYCGSLQSLDSCFITEAFYRT